MLSVYVSESPVKWTYNEIAACLAFINSLISYVICTVYSVFIVFDNKTSRLKIYREKVYENCSVLFTFQT